MNLAACTREALLAALQPVVGIVERRHTLPILGNVLLRQQGGLLALTTTDLECQVTAQAELGGGRGDATITVGAHKLLDIVRALPPGAALTMALARNRVTLTSGRSRFTLQTMPAEDFPALAPDEAAARWQLPRALWADLLDRVAFAMAAHDIRYYLNGVLVSITGQRLTVVATDGNRLAVAHAELPEPAGDAAAPLSFILPRKTVQELQRLLRPAGDGDVTLQIGAAQVRFELGAIGFTSKLIEGRFPDYERVLPKGNSRSVDLERGVLLASLERAALMTSDKFRGVRLDLEPGLLRIAASNAAQEEALEELSVNDQGPALQIGLNVGYVIELLKNTTAEQVRLSLRDAQTAVLFTLPAEPGFSYVVSPMRL